MRDEAYRLRGLRFYRFDEGSQTPTVVQLLRYDDSHQRYKMRDVFDGNTIYIDRATLEEKWVKLNPDGLLEFLSCTAVDNQGQEVPDVAVMLHRKDEYGHMLARPYAVCRQAVLDIFILLQQSRYVAGMTITEDTCPPEVKFEGCYQYKKVTHRDMAAVYMDDTLDDILKPINTKKYDDRLRLIKSRDQMHIPGYCASLQDLLHENYFMLDFHKAFDIHEFDFEKFDFDDVNTNRVLTEYIIRNKYEVPTRFYPVHYGKHIDLGEIQRKYILICPNSFKYPDGDITLLGYDVSETISFKNYVNKGMDPKEALRTTMRDLGWS